MWGLSQWSLQWILDCVSRNILKVMQPNTSLHVKPKGKTTKYNTKFDTSHKMCGIFGKADKKNDFSFARKIKNVTSEYKNTRTTIMHSLYNHWNKYLETRTYILHISDCCNGFTPPKLYLSLIMYDRGFTGTSHKIPNSTLPFFVMLWKMEEWTGGFSDFIQICIICIKV